VARLKMHLVQSNKSGGTCITATQMKVTDAYRLAYIKQTQKSRRISIRSL